MDHFFELVQGDSPAKAPMLEGFSAVSYLAAVTKRIKAGLLVAGNFYRHPGILVETVRTIDVPSKIHRGMSWRQRTKIIIKKVYP